MNQNPEQGPRDLETQRVNMAEPLTIDFFPGKGYEQHAKKFLSAYELIDAFFPHENNRARLMPKSQRTCRFCGRSQPETHFRKEAHLVPELLGNKLWLSDFECDVCNHFFGLTYENHLSVYMGISRSLTDVKVKGKKPGFKSGAIKVEHISPTPGSGVIIQRADIGNEAIRCNLPNGEIKIRFQRGSYIPVRVYKALLKMALSILPAPEIAANYPAAIDWLMNRNKKTFTGCLMNTYLLPFVNKQPIHALLFKKRDSKHLIHSHVINVYAQNFIFSFPIPLHQDDISFYQGGALTIPICPPLFVSKQIAASIDAQLYTEDFSSEQPLKGRNDELTLQVNPEDFANTAAFDPETGIIEQHSFNPSEIVKIIIKPNNGPSNLDELKRFVQT